ncbi:hypothetical protein GGX14DRAFT_480217, partial [Mycena pura]
LLRNTVLALTIVAAQAMPGPATLNKRYCGFDISCPCIPTTGPTTSPEDVCTPRFDTCEQVYYWPTACAGRCGTCEEHCLDPIHLC